MDDPIPNGKKGSPEPPSSPTRPTTASQNAPLVTLSWENINVNLPDTKDTLLGKLQCWKKNVPGKKLLTDGNPKKNLIEVTQITEII